MSGQEDPGSWVGRLFGWCLLALLAAMALYGAVSIVRSIWLFLCIDLAVAAVIAAVWRLLSSRYRGW
ncbi:hypothetical protein [Nostocoides vanveenii]|uniref:Uncharacterized protein n=1 Tax=Nostocoides vanveenii TaxID=330835 RepID=A0ABN2L8F1_9MICO